MKGQYFSFDALVAAVIMIVAFTSLMGYWYSTQYVIESHNSNLQVEAIRIANSLYSPGTPENWPSAGTIRQIGIAKGFSSDLNYTKVKAAYLLTLNNNGYAIFKNLLLVPGDANVSITITQSDSPIVGTNCPAIPVSGSSYYCQFGRVVPANAKEVAIANRGGTLEGRPVQVKVVLWRE